MHTGELQNQDLLSQLLPPDSHVGPHSCMCCMRKEVSAKVGREKKKGTCNREKSDRLTLMNNHHFGSNPGFYATPRLNQSPNISYVGQQGPQACSQRAVCCSLQGGVRSFDSPHSPWKESRHHSQGHSAAPQHTTCNDLSHCR